MKMTDNGIALIKRYEGFRGRAYKDITGIWTIGYGHTSRAGPPRVTQGMKISRQQAEDILRRDVARFAGEIRPLIKVELNDDQFSALVSFAYNVGPAAFARSSVLKMVNAGRFDAVPSRLALWVKAGGKTLNGLVQRRFAEAKLFAGRSASPLAKRKHHPQAVTGKPMARSTTVLATLINAIAGLIAALGTTQGRITIVFITLVIITASLWIVRERWLKSQNEGV